MNFRNSILFLSHHIKHPRNKYLMEFLRKHHSVCVPEFSFTASSTLSVSLSSGTNMLNLGLAGFGWEHTLHLDGIDVFIHSFIRNRAYLHDYHVPLVPELIWNRLLPLAKVAHFLLPESLSNAKVVIAPNSRMLDHAMEYANIPECFIVPNYPPKRFYKRISAQQAKYKLGIPENQTSALFIGGTRLREVYGIDLLLKTWFEVRKRRPDAFLYILGPYDKLGYDPITLEKFREKGIVFVGRVMHTEIPTWISAADLCLSQRTPGFPKHFYNIHDSLKLSEYALFKKPIVAAGYSDGKDYISVDTDIESYTRGILDCIDGHAPVPTPHTWEENIPNLRKAYEILSTYDSSSRI